MLNSMSTLLLFLVWDENTIFGQIWSKNWLKIFLFQMKLGIGTNSNSKVVFTFFCFGPKIPVLVQKKKNGLFIMKVESWWKLVPRLIQICWSWWWCSIVLFWMVNIFFGQIWSKIVCLKWNLLLKRIQISWIWWWCSNFFYLEGKHAFWANFN